jgi:AraC-like DNA-binding protein
VPVVGFRYSTRLKYRGVRIELDSDVGHELLAEGQGGTLPLTELRPDPRVGAGTFGFIDIRKGIVLCITDFLPATNVHMIAGPGVGYFTWSYYLEGHIEATVEGIHEPIRMTEGQRVAGFAAPGCRSSGLFAERCRNLIVSMCLPPAATAELLPTPETRRVAAWHDAMAQGRSLGEAPRPLQASQRAVLFQLLTCPFAGGARRLFLESKVLELLAQETAEGTAARKSLTADEESHVRAAARLLVERIDHPPTLQQLARAVATNELKLKRGFRILFGTTVFGYLRKYRLESARALLVRGDVNVAEAAQHVGYSCPSRFASAFRRQFGIVPSQVRQELH